MTDAASVHDTGSGAIAGIDDLVGRLAVHDYVCDRRLATVLYLALRMRRPLYLEGEAGVGKTELAKALPCRSVTFGYHRVQYRVSPQAGAEVGGGRGRR